jgi:catechol 2,3-dioxygenase-like lactoylglutathione lyase family enzyme
MAGSETRSEGALAYSIHHTNFPSTDLQRTADWYGKVFGLKPINISKWTPDATTLLMSNGNFHMHFELYPTVEIPRSTFEHRKGEHLFHVAIEVTDWDKFTEHLKEVGVTPEDYKQRPQDNSKSATITDPEGHSIEIVWHGNRGW